MPRPRVAGYILAGGKSSRMGQDKAMLTFGGKTLLARAVETMRAVTDRVAILGERISLEGAERAIADRHPGCGPLGGMEAALHDLVTNASLNAYEWACFLPVDMPLLPPGLYATLINSWLDRSGEDLAIAYAIADGAPQPLVSLVHRSVLPHLITALTLGHFKVTVVFNGLRKPVAFSPPASPDTGVLSTTAAITRTRTLAEPIMEQIMNSITAPLTEPQNGTSPPHASRWEPTLNELVDRLQWFSNLNTPGDLESIKASNRSATEQIRRNQS